MVYIFLFMWKEMEVEGLWVVLLYEVPLLGDHKGPFTGDFIHLIIFIIPLF